MANSLPSPPPPAQPLPSWLCPVWWPISLAFSSTPIGPPMYLPLEFAHHSLPPLPSWPLPSGYMGKVQSLEGLSCCSQHSSQWHQLLHRLQLGYLCTYLLLTTHCHPYLGGPSHQDIWGRRRVKRDILLFSG